MFVCPCVSENYNIVLNIIIVDAIIYFSIDNGASVLLFGHPPLFSYAINFHSKYYPAWSS